MLWVIFFVGLVVIAVFALVATGAMGELESDKSLDTDAPFSADQRIPLVLFGYQKTRVDKIILDLQNEIEFLKSKKK